MIVLKLYFCLMPLLFNSPDTSKHNIVVIGKAYNAKDGAWILSIGDEKHYFLDGIVSWDEKIEGKKVKVRGRLLIEELKDEPRISPAPGIPPPPIPQQIEGTIKRTILKAKWKLIK
jgi:hypothetical protein